MADSVKHINSAKEFAELLSSTQYVVADFYADWCGPCKAIAPMYAAVAKQLSIPNFLAFAKINVDTVQPVAQQYRVTAMPTFLFFKNSKQVAVNGNAMIQGADWNTLKLAADKLGRLAKEKKAAADAAADSK
ncbi:thioredoxin I [Apodospora peruviana]|uniref:Thioredoxin I n=1 Tax=Apodospora peruviana TaxID=516989 RepID=A0AAE0LZD5_9PEZI|nr:thioredoxin I [Apodospora peruviana]